MQLNKQTELCYLKGIRNGKNVQISSRDLLAGDVLMLSPGTIVPGDGLLIQSFDMFVDESMITGESDLVPKEEFKDGLGHPFLISGSVVASGTGLMVLC